MAISIPIVSEFDGKGIEKARKEFAQLEGVGAKAQYAIKKAAIPAAAALGGLGAALASATKGAIEDAAAQDKLAGQLRRSVNATDAQVKANEDFIASMGKAFGVTDDKLRPAIAKLTVASKDLARAQKLAKLAIDISAASGKDLESVTNALVKAENGQFASLKKLGVPIGDNTRALMDMAAETKKVHKAELDLERTREGGGSAKEVAKATANLAEAQARLNAVTVEGADYMTDLNKVFGGAAADAADTVAGRFQRLKVAMDETKESIGASLLPVIEKALPVLNKFGDWAQKNPEAFTKVAIAIGGVAAATVAVNAAMATNPYLAAAAGITTLVVALESLFQQLDKISKVKGLAARLFGQFIIPGANFFSGKIITDLFRNKENTTPAPSLGGADISRFSMPDVVPSSMTTNNGGAVTINVNGGDPQQVVDALRRYMKINGSIPIRTAF